MLSLAQQEQHSIAAKEECNARLLEELNLQDCMQRTSGDIGLSPEGDRAAPSCAGLHEDACCVKVPDLRWFALVPAARLQHSSGVDITGQLLL